MFSTPWNIATALQKHPPAVSGGRILTETSPAGHPMKRLITYFSSSIVKSILLD